MLPIIMGRPRLSRLVFFRVNYPHWWGKAETHDILAEAFTIKEGMHGDYRSRQWYTGELSQNSNSRWNFKLGKVRDDLTHSTLQAENGRYVFPVEGEGPVVPTVRCMFDAERSLLISEVSNEIGWQQVKGSLEAIIGLTRKSMLADGKDAGDIGKVVLQPLLEKSDFEAWTKKVDAVTKIRFKFWPTNPNPKKSFKSWDEVQREARADETKLEFRSKVDGLNSEAELIETGLAQVEAGYGEANATGRLGKLTKTWHSARNLVMTVVAWYENMDDAEEKWVEAADKAENDE